MKNNKKGFTLVELVIVVAVMAILVAVAIPTVKSITGDAKNAVHDSNARTIESMIKLAEADASKAANGVAELTATQIDTALTDAKLGIEDGTYIYNATKGTVTYGEADTAVKDEFIITFDGDADEAADLVVVTKKS